MRAFRSSRRVDCVATNAHRNANAAGNSSPVSDTTTRAMYLGTSVLGSQSAGQSGMDEYSHPASTGDRASNALGTGPGKRDSARVAKLIDDATSQNQQKAKAPTLRTGGAEKVSSAAASRPRSNPGDRGAKQRTRANTIHSMPQRPRTATPERSPSAANDSQPTANRRMPRACPQRRSPSISSRRLDPSESVAVKDSLTRSSPFKVGAAYCSKLGFAAAFSLILAAMSRRSEAAHWNMISRRYSSQ